VSIVQEKRKAKALKSHLKMLLNQLLSIFLEFRRFQSFPIQDLRGSNLNVLSVFGKLTLIDCYSLNWKHVG